MVELWSSSLNCGEGQVLFAKPVGGLENDS